MPSQPCVGILQIQHHSLISTYTFYRIRTPQSEQISRNLPLQSENTCLTSPLPSQKVSSLFPYRSQRQKTQPLSYTKLIHSLAGPSLPPPKWKEVNLLSGSLSPSVETSTFSYWHLILSLLKESIAVSPRASMQTTRPVSLLYLNFSKLRMPSQSISTCPYTSILLNAFTLRKKKVETAPGATVWTSSSLVARGGAVTQAMLATCPTFDAGKSQVNRWSCLSLAEQLYSFRLLREVSFPKQDSFEKFLPPSATRDSSSMTASAQMYLRCTYFHSFWPLHRLTQKRQDSLPKMSSSRQISAGVGMLTCSGSIGSNFMVRLQAGSQSTITRTLSRTITQMQWKFSLKSSTTANTFQGSSMFVQLIFTQCLILTGGGGGGVGRRMSKLPAKRIFLICLRSSASYQSDSSLASWIFYSDLFLRLVFTRQCSRLTANDCLLRSFFLLSAGGQSWLDGITACIGISYSSFLGISAGAYVGLLSKTGLLGTSSSESIDTSVCISEGLPQAMMRAITNTMAVSLMVKVTNSHSSSWPCLSSSKKARLFSHYQIDATQLRC